MKKVISLVLALAMVASLLCTAVFAAGSKTTVFEVTEDSKVETAETEVEEPEEETVAAAIESFTKAAESSEEANPYVDAEVLEAAANGKLTLASMADYKTTEETVVTEDGKYQVTIYGEGTEDWDVIVMALYEDAEEWEVVYAGKGGEMTFEVEADGTYAIYTVNEE